MVNFQQTPKPRNYFSRREQWRLLFMVMTLGLVAVLMMEAGKPQRWQWFVALDGGSDGSQPDLPAPAEDPIDTRMPPPDPAREIPGSFRSPGTPPPEAEEDTTGRYFPGIKPEYLQWVRDDKVFCPGENRAWLNLLDVLGDTDEATLEKASTGRVTFAQLFDQPKEYRGELVTVRGIVRRAHPMSIRGSDAAALKYHELYLFPDDNPRDPMIVYCLFLPEGFPTGMKLVEHATITAFHFKRCSYNVEASMLRAPRLAARTIHWHKTTATSQPAPDLVSLFAAITVAAVLCLSVTVYAYSRTRSTRTPQSEELPTFDILKEIEDDRKPIE